MESEPDGSSPHARGTQGLEARPSQDRRFIPARAGNTVNEPKQTLDPTGSSPHARGTPDDHATLVVDSRFIPHARGTRSRHPLHSVVVRFIPARAGNTSHLVFQSWSPSVHPRTRGEHAGRIRPQSDSRGSSPHARGTRRRFPRLPVAIRFIPARAGNTGSTSTLNSNKTVHPRTRGEHAMKVDEHHEVIGSSPHARGTPIEELGARINDRFIPARAGNTHRARARAACRAVHPRTRGEHTHIAAGPNIKFGSSPHARGTPPSALNMVTISRFIPARAGNTHPEVSFTVTPPVHPRTRGEHAPGDLDSGEVSGSSPHARGTPGLVTLLDETGRFIPARAGNTVTMPLDD